MSEAAKGALARVGVGRVSDGARRGGLFGEEPYRKVDLRGDGLLWLINRVVFHPRGFALAVDEEGGEFFLLWDGTEVGAFVPDDDDDCFARVQALFSELQGKSLPKE